ncbi:enoyl-CoA hydratase/isomerase family protein [Spirosoma arcticum]
MTYQDILVDIADRITTITLNRPAVMNAISPTMMRELKEAIEAVSQDESCNVLIVKGAGRAFSAGVDLKALTDSSGAPGILNGQFTSGDLTNDANAIARLLRTMPQPAIAVVHGHCYTGATELMMLFDLVIAADDAKIGDTHAKWGILPKWGMTQRLPRLVGIMKAKELSFTTKPITGQEAERIGLINRAVPLADLDQTVQELAGQILSNSAQTIAAMKHLYNEGMATTLADGLALESAFTTDITDRAEFLNDFEKNRK